MRGRAGVPPPRVTVVGTGFAEEVELDTLQSERG